MSRYLRVAVPVAAATAIAAVVVGVVVHRADDSDRPGRDEVIAALKRDPRTADVPDAATTCIADWYLTHASNRQLEALLDGADASTADTPDAALTAAAKAAIMDCLKQAT